MEINVTPLVDVCLVLLIIFMVATPKVVPELSVVVPPNRPANPRFEVPDKMVVGLSKAGSVSINRVPIEDHGRLGREIAQFMDAGHTRAVFFDFDDDASYGDAVEVFDVAKRNGAEVLGIVQKRNRATPESLPKI